MQPCFGFRMPLHKEGTIVSCSHTPRLCSRLFCIGAIHPQLKWFFCLPRSEDATCSCHENWPGHSRSCPGLPGYLLRGFARTILRHLRTTHRHAICHCSVSARQPHQRHTCKNVHYPADKHYSDGTVALFFQSISVKPTAWIM